MSADASSLADALALAFGHGPLAGIAPALVAEREGSAFRVRACWGVLDGSVALEARGADARRLPREDRPAGPAALAGARGSRGVAVTAVTVAGWAAIGAMKPPRVRWNTTEARVERFVRLAQRLELPVYGFEVRGRDVTVLTHPREAGSRGASDRAGSRRALVPRQRRRGRRRASLGRGKSNETSALILLIVRGNRASVSVGERGSRNSCRRATTPSSSSGSGTPGARRSSTTPSAGRVRASGARASRTRPGRRATRPPTTRRSACRPCSRRPRRATAGTRSTTCSTPTSAPASSAASPRAPGPTT